MVVVRAWRWTPCAFCPWLTAAAVFGRLAVGVEAAALRRRRFVLDARLGRIQVQATVLDVLVDPLGRFQEGFLHVLPTEEEEGNLRSVSGRGRS